MSMADNNGWARVHLGDIGQSLIGLTYSPSAVERSGTLVLRSSNIQDGRLAFDDNVYVNSVIPDKIRVRENDVLICVRNGSRRLIGKSVMLDHRVVGQTFGAFMAVYRSPSNRYLQYFFQSDEFRRQIDEHLGATINQITNASLNSFVVVLPSPAEQEAIVSRLVDLDRYIATLERLITKKQAIKQGLMQQLLTGRARFPGFDKPLREAAFGEVADVVMGQSPVGSSYNRDRIGVPLINGPTEFTAYSPIPKQWTTAPVRFCEPGDVLICVRGSSTGRMNIADTRYCIGRGVAAIRASGENDQTFIHYALTAIVNDLLKLQTGSTFPSIDSRAIRGRTVLVPERREQERIGVALKTVDDQLAKLKRKANKKQAIRQGMMQQLLTGRTRLAAKESAA